MMPCTMFAVQFWSGAQPFFFCTVCVGERKDTDSYQNSNFLELYYGLEIYCESSGPGGKNHFGAFSPYLVLKLLKVSLPSLTLPHPQDPMRWSPGFVKKMDHGPWVWFSFLWLGPNYTVDQRTVTHWLSS